MIGDGNKVAHEQDKLLIVQSASLLLPDIFLFKQANQDKLIRHLYNQYFVFSKGLIFITFSLFFLLGDSEIWPMAKYGVGRQMVLRQRCDSWAATYNRDKAQVPSVLFYHLWYERNQRIFTSATNIQCLKILCFKIESEKQ